MHKTMVATLHGLFRPGRVFAALYVLLFSLFCSQAVWADLTVPAQDRSYVTQLGIYVDESAALDIQEASQQNYRPFERLLSRTSAQAVRWIKIRVEPPAEVQEDLVLTVGPYYLSNLELYHQHEGRWIKQTIGANSAKTNLNCVVGMHCFDLSSLKGQGHTYFLRLQTLNGFYVAIEAITLSSLVSEAPTRNRLVGLEAGISLMLIGWSAIYFLKLRHALLGLFCLVQLTALAFGLVSNGLWLDRAFFDNPQLYGLVFNFLLCLRFVIGCLIGFYALRGWGYPKWFLYGFRAAIAFFLFELVLVLFGIINPVLLHLNLVFVLACPLGLVLATYQCKGISRKIKRYMTFGLLILIVVLWIDFFVLLNRSNAPLLINPGTWIGALAGLLIYLVILTNVKAQQEQLLQTMFEFNTLKVQNNHEQIQLRERSMLIDMLSHELKNPLATMRMALGSVRTALSQTHSDPEIQDRLSSMNQSIDNMNAVIDRCGQVDAFDQKTFVPRYEQISVLEVLESLAIVRSHPERFKFSGPPGCVIRTDLQLFSTIMTNLLDNAIKYSFQLSIITIDIKRRELALQLTVANFVDANHTPDPAALFTRYYRSPYAHDKPGTGLGLVLVRALCQLLEGSIRYRAENDQVFFEVELPV